MSIFAEIVLGDRLAEMTKRAEAAESALAHCQHDLAEMIERKEVLRNCWEVAEAALAERDKPCIWTVNSEHRRKYETGCTTDWFERKYLYCPDCGHPIEVQP